VKQKIKIILADSKNLITESLKTFFTNYADDMTIIGIAKDGTEVLNIVDKEIPDIISAFSKDRIVLLSTHIVSGVDGIACRIMMMEYGAINRQQTGEEFLKQINQPRRRAVGVWLFW
jgi:DNA-binding NarL/FixJ family response regulator